MQTAWERLLDDIAGDLKLRNALLSLKERISILNEYGIPPIIADAIQHIQTEEYDDFLDQLEIIVQDFYEEEWKGDLIERGFSIEFINAYDRLANKRVGRKSDVLVMHFSEDINLSDLAIFERALDRIYRSFVRASDASRKIKQFADDNQIIRIRAFTHPASAELFVDPVVIGIVRDRKSVV